MKSADTRDPRIVQAIEEMANENRRMARVLLEQVVAERGRSYAEAAVILARLMEGTKDLTGAEKMYGVAICSDDREWRPQAAINLGCLLRDDVGDLDRAETAFQLAVDSGHPDHAVAGVTNLARIAELRGDLSTAQVMYQQAIESRHPDYAPWAMLKLGGVLEESGDWRAARRLYRSVLGSDAEHVREDARAGLARIQRA